MPARYVGGNLVDLLSWDNIYIQLRTITVLHKKTNLTRFELILVGQIMGPIVQIVIQAPNLARMFFGDYWSNLPEGPLENPRWRPFFQDGRHFQYFFFFF